MRTPKKILIEGQKELNEKIKESLSKLIPLFKEVEGVKIFKKDGSLRKSHEYIKEAISKGVRHDGTSYPLGFLEVSRFGSLSLRMKICKNGGSFEDRTNYCEYFEKTIYIGNVDDGFTTVEDFKSIVSSYELDANLNADEQSKKVKEFKELREKLRSLYSEINPKIRQIEFLKL